MDDLNLLLRKLITFPDEDTYRLAFADEVEDRGNAVRARFVRRGVEAARPVSVTLTPADALRISGSTEFREWLASSPHNIRALGRNKRNQMYGLPDTIADVEIWVDTAATKSTVVPTLTGLFRERERRHSVAMAALAWHGAPWLEPWPGASVEPGVSWTYRGGFIDTLTAPAKAFLEHADDLLWTPPPACPKCHGEGTRWYADHDNGGGATMECRTCGGAGTVGEPAPCPDTAHPVRHVNLHGDVRVNQAYTSETDAVLWFGGDPKQRAFPRRVVEKHPDYRTNLPNRLVLPLLGLRFPGVKFALVWDRDRGYRHVPEDVL